MFHTHIYIYIYISYKTGYRLFSLFLQFPIFKPNWTGFFKPVRSDRNPNTFFFFFNTDLIFLILLLLLFCFCFCFCFVFFCFFFFFFFFFHSDFGVYRGRQMHVRAADIGLWNLIIRLVYKGLMLSVSPTFSIQVYS